VRGGGYVWITHVTVNHLVAISTFPSPSSPPLSSPPLPPHGNPHRTAAVHAHTAPFYGGFLHSWVPQLGGWSDLVVKRIAFL